MPAPNSSFFSRADSAAISDGWRLRDTISFSLKRIPVTDAVKQGSYLAHTQGKKHQTNLARRAAKEAKEAPAQPAPAKVKVEVKKFVKIGRPGYKVTKQRDSETGQQSLLFQIDYPEIAEGIGPRHRFMSAYEQRIEPPDRRWQYLLLAAEPYETIAFKLCILLGLCLFFFSILIFLICCSVQNAFWLLWPIMSSDCPDFRSDILGGQRQYKDSKWSSRKVEQKCLSLYSLLGSSGGVKVGKDERVWNVWAAESNK
ncbi:Splicing factor 3A subunit 2 [Liparis tanakae]|uniref:Splicing factor 3A subunit 2 n=1 Tax=Liparis tanakae TaxID=230148 RepID=A0A4Z2ILQ1_9TELE|nr:Splicing factor 3A subunit 2 [Liparis tanakae]